MYPIRGAGAGADAGAAAATAVVPAGSISEISPRYFLRLVETLLLGKGRPAEDGCCRMVIR